MSLCLVVAGLVAAGCSDDDAGGKAKTFRIGSAGAAVFDSPNPFVGISVNSYAANRYLYPYLVQYDKDLNIEGLFAKGWETSADGKTWTFETQEGVKWSDGKPMTAKDAAWTLETMLKFKDGPTAFFAPYLEGIVGVSSPSDTEVVVEVEEPMSALLANLQFLPILPEHVWAEHASGKGTGLKTFANHPPMVSGGPFNLAEYKDRSFALFTPNKNWWGPKPHVKGFGLQQFTSPDALVQALKANEIDLALALPPTAVKTVERTPGLSVQRVPGMQFYELGINSNPKKTDKPEIRDPQVRLAIAHALNRERLIDTFLLGAGRPGVSIIPPDAGRWSNKDLSPIPYDPDRANQILDGLGFRKGSDGIREANGHKMAYELIYLDTGNNRLVELMQADLKAVGIDLVLKLVGDAAYVPAIKAEDYTKFDISMDYWNASADPSLILSTQTCASLDNFSETAYCSKEYDRLFKQQATALDIEERERIVWEMQELLVKDRPYEVLFYPDAIEGLRDGWTGLDFTGTGSFNALSNASMLNVRPG